NFELRKGDLVAIMGVSGVGKTTLLNLLGLLDVPTVGKIFLDGQDILSKNEQEKAEIRNKKIGFVFQFYHLLPEFTALENVSFPLLIKGVEKKEALAKAFRLLKEVSLEDKAGQRPNLLSGGEQQRVAIARALVNDPELLLADEPTGNLDWKTGRRILELIQNLHQRKGLSSIIVTHNEKVAQFCHQIYLMEEGGLKLFRPKESYQ
ncbi:MAG: ABC transporter ATP-binding protein, partial [Candidatus Aminicenantales bacterium]